MAIHSMKKQFIVLPGDVAVGNLHHQGNSPGSLQCDLREKGEFPHQMGTVPSYRIARSHESQGAEGMQKQHKSLLLELVKRKERWRV